MLPLASCRCEPSEAAVRLVQRRVVEEISRCSVGVTVQVRVGAVMTVLCTTTVCCSLGSGFELIGIVDLAFRSGLDLILFGLTFGHSLGYLGYRSVGESSM